MEATRSSRSGQALVFSALASGLCLTLLLVSVPGCSKTQQANEPEAKPVPAKPPGQKPQAVSADKTSFSEVTEHLDPGGGLYLYMGTAQFCDGLAKKIDNWRAPLVALPGLPPDASASIQKGFDLVERLVRKSGVESISGIGLSGIALEPGFYQTKVFLHHYPGKGTGWLWSATGKDPHPLESLGWLPADTAIAGFGDLDAASLWTGIRAELVETGLPQVSAALDAFEAGFTQQTDLKWGDVVGSLGGDLGIILTLDAERKVSLPVPTGTELTFPEPGLLLALRVKNDLIFDRLDQGFHKHPDVLAVDKDGLRMRTVAVPLPIALNLRPTVARVGDYLLIASNEQLIQRVLDVRAGKIPGLKAAEEFTKLAKGMDLSGNQFTFISRRFSDALAEIQKAAITGASGPNGPPAALMQQLLKLQTRGGSFAVSSRLPDGLSTVSHGNQDPVGMLLVPAVVAPTAIMAGMLLPALSQAKNKAQDINCMNNLKQIGLAARMYASDNNDTFPSSFLSLSNYLAGSPVVLVCPLDRERVDPQKLTWATLQPSDISYEMLQPGVKDSPDLAAKEIFRCRRHPFVCLGDGRAVRHPTNNPSQ